MMPVEKLPALPEVSILVAMHNAGRYVGETLRCLLQQEGVALEIIIVDDHSTDDSCDVVRSFRDERVRLLQCTGTGISAALNTGLGAARAGIFMRCDADDLYPPGRIRAQCDWLDANPAYGAVCGGFATLDERGRLVADLPTGDVPADVTGELTTGTVRTHLGTFAVRTDLARRLGGFRGFFVTAEDQDFQLRLADIAKVMYLPRQWYLYRLHQSSIIHRQQQEEQRYYRDMARVFQAQRRQLGGDDLELGRPPPAKTLRHVPAEKAVDHIIGMIIGAAWAAHRRGAVATAVRTVMRCFRYTWTDPRAWRALLFLLLKSTAPQSWA